MIMLEIDIFALYSLLCAKNCNITQKWRNGGEERGPTDDVREERYPNQTMNGMR
jgi:hypothetical protein